MSSLTQDLLQPLNTLSQRPRGGAPLGRSPENKGASCRLDLVGQRFGSVTVVSPEVLWLGQRNHRVIHVLCECVTCGYRSVISLRNLQIGRTKGCGDCNRQVRAYPAWLQHRVEAMRSRCRNPRDKGYPNYGGRGIEFRFDSVAEGCRWIRDNLGIAERHLELDRIDNDWHYEPGNLRWATPLQNHMNRRNSVDSVARLHAFRLRYPEVRYADATLRRLFYDQLTNEQIVERYAKPSRKPKGVYGTFVTPDPAIASRLQGC